MPAPDLKPREIRGAIDALKRRRQHIAFDANMFKVLHYDIPYTRSCAKEYDRITAEIAALEALLPAKKQPPPAEPPAEPAEGKAQPIQRSIFDDQ